MLVLFALSTGSSPAVQQRVQWARHDLDFLVLSSRASTTTLCFLTVINLQDGKQVWQQCVPKVRSAPELSGENLYCVEGAELVVRSLRNGRSLKTVSLSDRDFQGIIAPGGALDAVELGSLQRQRAKRSTTIDHLDYQGPYVLGKFTVVYRHATAGGFAGSDFLAFDSDVLRLRFDGEADLVVRTGKNHRIFGYGMNGKDCLVNAQGVEPCEMALLRGPDGLFISASRHDTQTELCCASDRALVRTRKEGQVFLVNADGGSSKLGVQRLVGDYVWWVLLEDALVSIQVVRKAASTSDAAPRLAPIYFERYDFTGRLIRSTFMVFESSVVPVATTSCGEMVLKGRAALGVVQPSLADVRYIGRPERRTNDAWYVFGGRNLGQIIEVIESQGEFPAEGDEAVRDYCIEVNLLDCQTGSRSNVVNRLPWTCPRPPTE